MWTWEISGKIKVLLDRGYATVGHRNYIKKIIDSPITDFNDDCILLYVSSIFKFEFINLIQKCQTILKKN